MPFGFQIRSKASINTANGLVLASELSKPNLLPVRVGAAPGRPVSHPHEFMTQSSESCYT